MRIRALAGVIALLTFAAAFLVASPEPVRAAGPKVAIIVGPAGPTITPLYITWADQTASAAEAAGATVAKAYSPNADPARVLAAVEGANVIVYYGHGNGFPNPYSSVLDPNKVNGWGLQGPYARGTHEDSWSNGTMKYYGEAWITANARPAPGFVMIYSNACYAPGASEPGQPLATADQALQRVANYSRGVLNMGASAYYATDFWQGAATLVSKIVGSPDMTYGDIFRSEPQFRATALQPMAHPQVAGRELWLHLSPNSSGETSYWYAFAGNPNATPASSGATVPGADRTAPSVIRAVPASGAVGIPTTSPVQVWFSEPVTGVSSGTFVLRDAAGGVVPASVSYDAAARAARLQPAAPLAAAGRYTVALSGSIRDALGNPLRYISWSFSTAAAGSSAAGESYNPARGLSFAAGTHTGYQFSAAGAVTARRTASLSRASSASTTRRAAQPGQSGMWFYVSNGIWAGYWVRESPAVYLPGVIAQQSFNPARSVSFGAGTHTGYLFSATGGVSGTRSYTLPRASGASAGGRAVINGRPYLLIGNGIWAGYWMPESSAVRLL